MFLNSAQVSGSKPVIHSNACENLVTNQKMSIPSLIRDKLFRMSIMKGCRSLTLRGGGWWGLHPFGLRALADTVSTSYPKCTPQGCEGLATSKYCWDNSLNPTSLAPREEGWVTTPHSKHPNPDPLLLVDLQDSSFQGRYVL